MSSTKLFVWIDNQAEEIRFSNNPPNFYEFSKKDQEDFQIVYFIKSNVVSEIVDDNINDSIFVGSVDGDPLDDILNKMNQNFLNDKNAWT